MKKKMKTFEEILEENAATKAAVRKFLPSDRGNDGFAGIEPLGYYHSNGGNDSE